MTNTATPAVTPEPDAARPLRPFFILWSGQAVSLLGSQAVQFGLIWWLTVQTGSATMLAAASLVGLLPQVVLGPLAGALVDRAPRKRILAAADGGVALVSAGLALLFLLDRATPAWVFVALFARSLGGVLHQNAMLAATSQMVPPAHLTRIQGMNQSLQGAMLIGAAPLGALLVQALPMAGVVAIDVATAAFALVPLAFVRVPEPAGDAVPGAPRPSLVRELAEGFAYLGARPGHLRIVLLAGVVNLFLVPAFSLLPLLVSDTYRGSAAQFATLNVCFGVGMLAGGLALGAFSAWRPRIVVALVGLIGLGIGVAGVGLAPAGQSWWPAIAMLVVGWMVPTVNGPIIAALQATIEPSFQGRVFGLVTSLAAVAAPLGLTLAAPVAELFGVRAWYVAGALASALMGVAGFLSRPLLRIEDTAPPD